MPSAAVLGSSAESRVHLTVTPRSEAGAEAEAEEGPRSSRKGRFRAHDITREGVARCMVTLGRHAGPHALLALIVLYARIGNASALLSGTRQRILATLRERGPLSVPALAAALSLDATTIAHHARILTRARAIEIRRIGRRRFALLPGQSLADGILSRRTSVTLAERILIAAERAGGAIAWRALDAALAGVSERSRRYALHVLVGHGLVEIVVSREGKLIRLTGRRVPADA